MGLSAARLSRPGRGIYCSSRARLLTVVFFRLVSGRMRLRVRLRMSMRLRRMGVGVRRGPWRRVGALGRTRIVVRCFHGVRLGVLRRLRIARRFLLPHGVVLGLLLRFAWRRGFMRLHPPGLRRTRAFRLRCGLRCVETALRRMSVARFLLRVRGAARRVRHAIVGGRGRVRRRLAGVRFVVDSMARFTAVPVRGRLRRALPTSRLAAVLRCFLRFAVRFALHGRL